MEVVWQFGSEHQGFESPVKGACVKEEVLKFAFNSALNRTLLSPGCLQVVHPSEPKRIVVAKPQCRPTTCMVRVPVQIPPQQLNENT